MNYANLQKDETKIEKIEKFFTDKIYYDNCYRVRRHKQIIEAKNKARKEKRIQQRKEKREQLKTNEQLNRE